MKDLTKEFNELFQKLEEDYKINKEIINSFIEKSESFTKIGENQYLTLKFEKTGEEKFLVPIIVEIENYRPKIKKIFKFNKYCRVAYSLYSNLPKINYIKSYCGSSPANVRIFKVINNRLYTFSKKDEDLNERGIKIFSIDLRKEKVDKTEFNSLDKLIKIHVNKEPIEGNLYLLKGKEGYYLGFENTEGYSLGYLPQFTGDFEYLPSIVELKTKKDYEIKDLCLVTPLFFSLEGKNIKSIYKPILPHS